MQSQTSGALFCTTSKRSPGGADAPLTLRGGGWFHLRWRAAAEADLAAPRPGAQAGTSARLRRISAPTERLPSRSSLVAPAAPTRAEVLRARQRRN
jgi:hypothetical protein